MGDNPNRRGVSRHWLMTEVENSLRRLETDWIDVYQIRRYEPDVDLDETLGALTELVHRGKVRYIGSSTRWRKDADGSGALAMMPAAEVRRARRTFPVRRTGECCGRRRAPPERLPCARGARHRTVV